MTDQEPPRPPMNAAPAAFKGAALESSKARSKFTEKRRNTILTALQAGHMEATAAALAGIGVSTLRDWLRIGATDLDQDVESDYARFTERAMQAIALAEHRALRVVQDRIEQRGPDQLKAAQWFLERGRSQNWGKTDRVDVNHTQDGPVVIQLTWPGARHSDDADEALELEAGPDPEIVDAEIIEPDTDDRAAG